MALFFIRLSRNADKIIRRITLRDLHDLNFQLGPVTSFPQDHPVEGLWEHVSSPGPQGFSSFTQSTLSAKAGNRPHRKQLAKVKLPSFSLQLQCGNDTSISFFVSSQKICDGNPPLASLFPVSLINPLPAPMPDPEHENFGTRHMARRVEEEPDAPSKNHPREDQANYLPHGSVLSEQTVYGFPTIPTTQ